MPNSLLFNGTSDQIVVTRGNVNGAGARTFGVIAKFSADGAAYRNFFGIDGVDSWFGTDNGATRHLAAYSGVGAPAITTTITVPSSDGWCFYGFTMPNDGEARFHKYVYSTRTWTHEQVVGGFISDPTMAAAFRLGCAGNSAQFFPGNMLVVGIWDVELSDATIETLNTGLTPWMTTLPAEIWRLDRTSTLYSPIGSSSETSRSGTTLDVDDAPPGWTDLAPSRTYVRQFDGTDDYVQVSDDGIGDVSASALSLVMVVRPTSLGAANDPFFSLGTSSVNALGLTDEGGGSIGLASDASTTSIGSVGLTANEWQVIGVSYTNSSTRPRFHRKVLGSGSWTHVDGDVNHTLSSGSNDRIYFGIWPNDAGFVKDMVLAVAAFWYGTTLTDEQFEAIASNASTRALKAMLPTSLWEFNQAAVAQQVTNQMVNGAAAQASRVGTAVVSDVYPPWRLGTFPTQPDALDLFDRSNASPPTGWSAPLQSGGQSLEGVSNRAGSGTGWFALRTFGPDCETWAPLSALPADGDGGNSIYLRLDPALVGSAGITAYRAIYRSASGQPEVLLFRQAAGASNFIDSVSVPALAVGDAWGISAYGEMIQAHVRRGGVWEVVLTAIDANITAAGYLGIDASNVSFIDSFHGWDGTPQFIGAGSGAERLTAGSFTVSKTGCKAGNLVAFHMYVNGTTGDWGGFTNRTNVENLGGESGALEFQINATDRQLAWGRVRADGTVSADVTVGASGEDIAARIYEFSGEFPGNTLAKVLENGAGNNTEAAATSTSIGDADVTSNGPYRLALNFVGVKAARTLGNFTGETGGGDWVEAVAEYQGTTVTLQLQRALLPKAGVIDGGAQTITSAAWQTIGTAIIPDNGAIGRPSAALSGI